MINLEFLAGIFVILMFMKLLIFLFAPDTLRQFGNIWIDKEYSKYICLAGFVFLLWVLLDSITIVEFFVALMAASFLIAFTLMHLPKKHYWAIMKSVTANRTRFWLPWLVYIVIALWVVNEVLLIV